MSKAEQSCEICNRKYMCKLSEAMNSAAVLNGIRGVCASFQSGALHKDICQAIAKHCEHYQSTE